VAIVLLPRMSAFRPDRRLERRTGAVGRDTISHPDRGRDDIFGVPARLRFPN